MGSLAFEILSGVVDLSLALDQYVSTGWSVLAKVSVQSSVMAEVRPRDPSNTSNDPIEVWLQWVAEEERSRVGWFAFMMDVENAALYRWV